MSRLSNSHHDPLALQIDTAVTRVQQDTTKPFGEACNADGTLKDATEISWLNSPSDETRPTPSFSKRARSVDAEQGSSKRSRVSKKTFLLIDKRLLTVLVGHLTVYWA